MVPLIISHDGTIHNDSVRRWKNLASDITVDWVGMVQNVLRYNVVIVGRFFNEGSWASEVWRKEHPEEFADDLGPARKNCNRLREKSASAIEPRTRGLRACAVFGHATSTRRSVDLCCSGKPTHELTNLPT